MSVRTQSNGQIQPKAQQGNGNGKPEVIQLVERYKGAIEQALPRHINGERMSRVVLTAFRSTPALLQCEGASVIGSILQASQLGLEPNTPLGHCWLLPYKDKCQLIIGYQGMIELSMRSGLVSSIYAFPVYEGDVFDHKLGTEMSIHHEPREQSEKLTHVYAVARIKGSEEPIFTVLSRAAVDKYRERSASKRSGPWVTDYDAMALKTAVRRLWKWLPKSPEMATAVALEDVSEQGRPQSGAWDPLVTEEVERGGLQVIDAPAEPPMREMGEEG